MDIYLVPFVSYEGSLGETYTHNVSRTLILTGNYCGLPSEFIIMGA